VLQSTALAYDTGHRLRFELGGLRGIMPFADCVDAAPGETVTVPAQVELPAVTAEELEQVLAFLRDTGLPLTLAQLGVKEIVPETLKKVAEAAVVPTQSTKNLRADITAQEVYDAILEADRIGRDYLAR